MSQSITEKFSQSVDLKGALVSVTIADMETGEVLDAINPDHRLTPASAWKLFTTAAALKILTPEFKFRTVVAYDGMIEKGILTGNVYILGGGDPSLGSSHFAPDFEQLLATWVSAIRRAGIDSINGRLVANTAHFKGDGMPRTWIWEDMGNYYGAAVSGLNINDNTYSVGFRVPREPGNKATLLSVNPEVPGLQIKSEVISSTIQSDRAFIFGAPNSNHRMVRGTLPAGRDNFKVRGSIPNPPLFAVSHLLKALKLSGVGVSSGITVEEMTERNPADYHVIHEHLSNPLRDLVTHINVRSDNLYAEAILCQIGAANGDGSLEGGLERLHEFYESILFRDYPFFAYDGSGLSRFTAVSTAQISNLLWYCNRDEMLRKELLGNLPVAGVDGTMRWFGQNTKLSNNLRAKSGSMDNVRAYAGFFNAQTGRRISFAVIVNNFDPGAREMRQKIEAMLMEIYEAY